jgi:hypothetical protein
MEFKSGANFTRGRFTSRCSSCDSILPIYYVFYVLCTGRVLVQECEDCMCDHF